ncbi:MAG: Ig-like domain-containing protein [Candidatus Hatepunaea meridiana]|nr:Ig-like domain-containing protein [Candidatus Hatepunaea meridiana]
MKIKSLSALRLSLFAIRYSLFLLLSLFVISCEDEEAPTAPVIDHLAPLVEWIAPVNGDDLSGTVDIVFTASDEGGIERTQVYLNGFPPDDFQTSVSDDTLFTIEWNTCEVEDGVYILEARAWDEAGNLGISPALLVNLKNDTGPREDHIPPYVWWIAPEPGSTLSDTANLQIGFYDENVVDSVSLLKNGALVSTIAAAGESLDYLWDTRADSDGVYIWEARAWDETGNMGSSPSLLVKVRNNLDPPPEDRTPPVVTWRSPEPGTEVSGEVELSFQVMDDIGLDSVKVYLNGQELQNLINLNEFLDADVIWITSDYPDRNYIIEVRAWDSSGNMGTSVIVSLTVRNDIPRVIWVPDDYETIQGAINASEDGDTVRVRAGVYRECIRFWGWNIWLESEYGSKATILDGTNFNSDIFYSDGGEDSTSGIRGFTIKNSTRYGIQIPGITAIKILNNVIINSETTNLFLRNNFCIIRNNVFANTSTNIQLRNSWGVFENNIVINSSSWAIWNVNIDPNPIVPDYNLIWQYGELTNNPPIHFGEHNLIDVNPIIIDEFYHLDQESPCLDAGNPKILDIDGSRSDIGAFGGPYAYPVN